MTFQHACIVLPCHSLEDFPTHHVGRHADSILANWTTLWHPQLVKQTGQAPGWRRPDELVGAPPEGLFLIPSIVKEELPFGFQRKVESAGGRVLIDFASREDLLNQLFEDDSKAMPSVAPFMALGYAYLQVQLMTRQLRGSSNLDETRFEESLLKAADAWGESPMEDQTHLQSCFDLLIEEKNSYYPVPSSFVELILTTPQTVQAFAGEELANSDRTQNWLVSAKELEQIQQDPEVWEIFSSRIAEQDIQLVGGVLEERPFRLLPPELLVRDLLSFDEKLKQLELTADTAPKVFAQRTPGLTAHYPAILEATGFVGALHMRFEPVPFPSPSSSNIRWEGESSGGLVALTEEPRNATNGEAFLRLGVDIGEQIDSAHVSTLVFAHWPGHSHFVLNDLLEIQKFGNLFGNFISLGDYFEDVYDPGYPDDFSNSEYSFNGLAKALRSKEKDPVSNIVSIWISSLKFQELKAYLTLQVCQNLNRLDDLRSLNKKLETAFEKSVQNSREGSSAIPFGDELAANILELAAVGDSPKPEVSKDSLQSMEVLNLHLPRRLVHLQVPGNVDTVPVSVEPATKSLVLADYAEGIWDLIVDLPGYSSAPIQWQVGRHPKPKSPSLVENQFLRNEFFEVEIDLQSGGIRGINLYQRRQNLVSQRLAIRESAEMDAHGQPKSPSRYCEPQDVSMRVLRNNAATGVVQTSGSLYRRETKVAEFEQTMKLTRGSRVVEIQVKLDRLSSFRLSRQDYVCSRLAWKHDSEELLGGVHGLRSFISGQTPESATFFEWVHPQHQLTLITGGLPYHRRGNSRTLDTVLIAHGESSDDFRFGIGVNLPYGELAAREFLLPPQVVTNAIQLPSLVHLNQRNVLVTQWDWISDEQNNPIGCKLWLREVQGKSGTVSIACRKGLQHASRANFIGEFLFELETNGNVAMFSYEAFEFGEIHLYWNS